MEYIHGKDRLLPRVSSVEIRPDYHLLLTFRNGEKRLFDVSELLNLPAYRSIKNVFSSVRVVYGTVVWPGDVDISPETLYLRSVPADSLGTLNQNLV